MRKILLISTLLLAMPLGSFAAKSLPPFKSHIGDLSEKTEAVMKEFTWKPNCPVPLTGLAEVKLSYYGFDNKTHQGTLIVNKDLAPDVVGIFKELYYAKFPIERMEVMDNFKGSDDAAMAVNDTSSFNCRPVTGKTNVFSQHSYGRAIDINTLINPYVKHELVLPAGGKSYVDRNQPAQGKITKDSLVYNEFKKHGWSWGGDWHDLQDYQHFEKREHNQIRNPDGEN